MNATITQISDSADIVWEALCVWDDTRDADTARAALGDVSDEDRALFEECLAQDIEKLARLAKAEERERSTRAARNAAAAIRSGAHAAEGAILARQELDF